MSEVQSTLIDHGMDDRLAFGNCKHRFIDPTQAPDMHPIGPEFEGVVCVDVPMTCPLYFNEVTCGLWEPRDPSKGRYFWNKDPYKGKYGHKKVIRSL